ncbi:hypothetical protein LTR62_003017 [Meristemomyces frigidus]|uniref:t-SNARE coiled-coil homology domain-containing protein n=1 Tax=Meristemomyces frigidus TaxID=1508187 RepID=A0AAN7TIF4_9PEZI|nr:hypothetical protein LTR62_003017 [Meristemomyces frigidus]
MTDITPHLNLCLKAKDAQLIRRRDHDIHKINSFLQEAYSINARISDLTRELRSIRPAYLSTAPPPRRRQLATNEHGQHDRGRPLTDVERDAIDAQSKQLLRQLNGGIQALKQAEEVRLQTAESVALSKRAKTGLGALGRWAAGNAATAQTPEEEFEDAARRNLAKHRESVIVYLQRRLEAAGGVQAEMMEVRLSREVERSKSVLYKSRLAGGGQTIPYANQDNNGADNQTLSSPKRKRQSANLPYDSIRSATEEPLPPEELTQDQLLLFASENSEMLKLYTSQLSQLHQAEKSILEISELQTTLVTNLETQSEFIGQLVEDSYSTTENLGKGNKELKRASERRSTAQGIFYATCGFCAFLVAWDLVF